MNYEEEKRDLAQQIELLKLRLEIAEMNQRMREVEANTPFVFAPLDLSPSTHIGMGHVSTH